MQVDVRAGQRVCTLDLPRESRVCIVGAHVPRNSSRPGSGTRRRVPAFGTDSGSSAATTDWLGVADQHDGRSRTICDGERGSAVHSMSSWPRRAGLSGSQRVRGIGYQMIWPASVSPAPPYSHCSRATTTWSEQVSRCRQSKVGVESVRLVVSGPATDITTGQSQ